MIGLECLAVAIFFESRGEPLEGQELVAEVILNRVKDHRFPNTICDVVYQRKQFSFTHDGITDDLDKFVKKYPEEQKTVNEIRTLAERIIEHGHAHTSSTHYHAVNVSPQWANTLIKDGKMGNHIFYTWD